MLGFKRKVSDIEFYIIPFDAMTLRNNLFVSIKLMIRQLKIRAVLI